MGGTREVFVVGYYVIYLIQLFTDIETTAFELNGLVLSLVRYSLSIPSF